MQLELEAYIDPNRLPHTKFYMKTFHFFELDSKITVSICLKSYSLDSGWIVDINNLEE